MFKTLDTLAQFEQECSIMVDLLLDALDSGSYSEDDEMLLAEALQYICELGDAARNDFKLSVSMN